MRKLKIEVDVTISDSNEIGINMTADSEMTAFDFIRVVNSLSESTQNLIEEYCDNADEVESIEDAEKVLLKDLGKFVKVGATQ